MTTSETEEVKNESIIEEKEQIKKILVPLDGSNCSFRAAKYAIEVARLQKAQIFCVHVINKIPYGYSLPGSSLEEYFENVKDQARSWFTQVIDISKKEAADKNSIILDIKTDIIRGLDSVTDAIITFAAKNKIDLIMMGTKGTTGLKRFLIGSVAQGVVQHAHCSVLLVR
jgi:nucleotide-binding universal stress UspA family protein